MKASVYVSSLGRGSATTTQAGYGQFWDHGPGGSQNRGKINAVSDLAAEQSSGKTYVPSRQQSKFCEWEGKFSWHLKPFAPILNQGHTVRSDLRVTSVARPEIG